MPIINFFDLHPDCVLEIFVSAVCVSIDHFLQDPPPTCCLPFDGIGTRHHGIAVSAGQYVDLERAGNSVLPFDFWPVGPLTIIRSSSCRRHVVDPCEWPDNGNELKCFRAFPKSGPAFCNALQARKVRKAPRKFPDGLAHVQTDGMEKIDMVACLEQRVCIQLL